MAEVLFWPALLGYGEAAFAYASPRYTRLGTWGVRIGWLAQTALLAVQAARVDGFPWSTWAGSLNLFVWLVVGVYLIWGCRPRYRLLGLAVMPLVAVLFVVARVGGGTTAGERSRLRQPLPRRSTSGSCSRRSPASRSRRRSPALYLLEERRLQRRAPDILRLRLPSLVVLERVTLRTIAISLPLLTVGLVAGFVRLRQRRRRRRRADGGDDRHLARLRASSSRCGRPAAAAALRRAARLRPRDPRPARARREPLLKLSLVGISHHVAPVELRERVALPLERAASLARALGDAVCLSTCNRTELYLAGDDDGARARVARGARRRAAAVGRLPDARRGGRRPPLPRLGRARLARPRRERDPRPGARGLRRRRARAAARPGLPPGAPARQARADRDRDRREPGVGSLRGGGARRAGLRRPRRPARAARRRRPDRRARRRQPLGARRLDRLRREPQRRRRRRRSRPASARRRSRSTRSRTSSARSTSCSPRRARRGSWSGRGDVPARRRHPLFFIDIAVPRDVDPVVHELDGCYLYDIDDLEAVVAETLAGRRVEAERAEQLVAEEAERFREWQASLDVVPAIASLRARAEEIRAAELAKLAALPEHERRTLESVTAQIVNKLLHLPTVRMKEAAAADDGRDVRRRRPAPVRPRRRALSGRRRAGPDRLAWVAARAHAGRACRGGRAAGRPRGRASCRSRPPATATARARSARSARAASSSRRSRRRCSPAGSTSPSTRRRT